MIILLFIAWGALSGLRVGLARSLTSLAGLLAGWAVAALLTGQAVALADARWGVVDSLAGSLEQILPASTGGIPLVDAYRDQLVPRLGGELAARPDVDPGADPAAAPTTGPAVPAAAGQPIHQLLAWGIASALAFVLLFAVTRLVFTLLGHLLHITFDSAPLRPLNRVLGAAFTAVRNGLIAALVLGLLAPALVIGPLAGLHGLIDASAYAPLLLRVFYMVNPWIFGAPPGGGA